ncbi:MAG TPA: hypothetical protein VD931_22820 [Baekduia sp.]|nr:hypothetical protein [Baekduia sp.]
MIQSYRTAGNTDEQVVCTRRCLVYSITPELTTTGTVTLRDDATAGGSNIKHVSAIGLTQAGKTFPRGVLFERGVTVKLSAATDLTLITFEPV